MIYPESSSLSTDGGRIVMLPTASFIYKGHRLGLGRASAVVLPQKAKPIRKTRAWSQLVTVLALLVSDETRFHSKCSLPLLRRPKEDSPWPREKKKRHRVPTKQPQAPFAHLDPRNHEEAVIRRRQTPLRTPPPDFVCLRPPELSTARSAVFTEKPPTWRCGLLPNILTGGVRRRDPLL